MCLSSADRPGLPSMTTASRSRRRSFRVIAARRLPSGSGPTARFSSRLTKAPSRRLPSHFVTAEVESVAICFLHSYRTPEHEARAKAAVKRLMPDVFISVSSEILPEFREFERLSTTAVNAFVGPRMGRYLEQFRTRVRSIGIMADPYTIHSNGGLMSVDTVRDCPVRTCVSGPAAGVVGAAEIGRAAGLHNLITFDVGGTSTDVSLIYKSAPLYTNARLVAGYPVKTPMIDINVIGAGGGSIAAIDDAGAMKVGPRSAGADPGPVAYGRGGTEPTITDANLCLGRLDPDTMLGGRMHVDLEAARRVIHERIAKPLGLTLEAAAHGVIQIANANMSRAIRSVSIERGYDIGTFALCAFGGAGPLHAAEVAVECGLPQVLIPREPGTTCARGMLLTDLSSDYVRSHFADAAQDSWSRILGLFEEMEREGQAWLDREGIPSERRRFKRVLDARYRGQNFEVKVPCDDLRAGDLSTPHRTLSRVSHARIWLCDLRAGCRVRLRSGPGHRGGPEGTAGGDRRGWVAERRSRRKPPGLHGRKAGLERGSRLPARAPSGRRRNSAAPPSSTR